MNRDAYPTLSLITLTRNRADLLAANLTSLLGQLSSKDEIIVIDNGSTDHTPLVIRAYKHLLPIRNYRLTRGKYPQLYNAGIRHAKKDIIVFLDDDCIADPQFIRRIRIAHHKRPRAAIQGITFSLPHGNIYADIMGDHYRHFIATNRLHGGYLRVMDNKNASIATPLIRSVGGFCEQLDCGSEDIEIGIRLRSRGIPIILDERIVAHHHERTTFGTFMAQHLRFARCEGRLDRSLPPDERVGLVRIPKLKLQVRSAYAREYAYIRQHKWKEAILLPIVYIMLSVIRTYGYITGI